jgi:hypothetical protein
MSCIDDLSPFYSFENTLGKESIAAITMITITEITTSMSGTTEYTASPLFMCLLTRRKRIPETNVAKAAKKKENQLKYIISADNGSGAGEPSALYKYFRKRSKRSTTKPKARSDTLVLDHARNVRSLAIWLRCQAKNILSSLSMAGGLQILAPLVP